MIEYGNSYKNENGTIEIELKIKTECSTKEEIRDTLSFYAQKSRRFYLEIAEKINSVR